MVGRRCPRLPLFRSGGRHKATFTAGELLQKTPPTFLQLDRHYHTTCRLLRKKGFSLRASIKKRKGVGLHSPDQDKQFEYIASQRREFTAAGLPIISVDTKKKELIGNFYKRGKTWCKEAIEVNEYDFPSMAKCLAVPYGVYDVTRNRGYVYVGTSGNTPEFAVDNIVRWWKEEGCVTHPGAAKLLILADGGGGNGYRSRAWKQQLQRKLSDGLGLTVTVCHYPSRCSKWNPIERRLFSHISINWAGKPLLTLEMMLGYIRGTSTATGLTVKAFLQEGIYRKGQKVMKQEMPGRAGGYPTGPPTVPDVSN
jgi:Rhodopirellula transposase DDE domain